MDKPNLVAIDVAILPPPDIAARAIALSASLPARHFKGLRLDAERLPHITLTQQFVGASALDMVAERLGAVLADEPPLALRVTGGDKGSSSVWMAVARTPALVALHERLMAALENLERRVGTTAAFVDGDARVGDLQWVSGFRRTASFDRFVPHITLGHAKEPPPVAPVAFEADVVALCHLGRFCTCRRVLHQWTLRGH